MNDASVIVYRSLSVGWPSTVDLFYLLAQARERNELEGLSGILLYDRGRYYQWIEGQDRALHAVWDSIRKDMRHTDIEVLGDDAIPFRLFTQWSMQFAHRDEQLLRFMDGFAAAEPDLLDELHHASPTSVPRLLAGFSRFDPAPACFLPGSPRS